MAHHFTQYIFFPISGDRHISRQSTPLSTASSEDHLRTEPFSEVHGITVLVSCESLQFRLQMAVDETGENMSQVSHGSRGE